MSQHYTEVLILIKNCNKTLTNSMQMKVSQEVCKQTQRAGIKIVFSQRERKTMKTNAVIPSTGCSCGRDQVMRNPPSPVLYFNHLGISIYSSIYGLTRHGSIPHVASPKWDLLSSCHNVILLFTILDIKNVVNIFEFQISLALLSYKTGFACLNTSNAIWSTWEYLKQPLAAGRIQSHSVYSFESILK